MGKLGFRHTLAGLCIAASFAAFEGSAQAQQPPAAPAQPGAPAQPAPLPPLPASQIALARTLMSLSGITANFDAIIGNVAQQLLAIYVQKRPANAKDFEEILLSMKPELDAKKKELLDKAADAYGRKLDEPTMKAAIAFLQTPAGQKYAGALPDILNSIADATEAWTRDIATLMGQRVVDEMKKRGVDIGR